MTKNKLKLPVIYLISFLANLGIGMLNFTLVFFVKDRFDINASFVGLMSGLWALFYLAGCIVLRKVSARLKPLHAVLIAAVSMGLSVAAILLINKAAAVFILYSFFGFITALYWPPLMGWLSQGIEGKDLSKTLSRFNMSWSTGSSISPYIAGMLIGLNLIMPLWIIVIIYFLISLTVILMIRIIGSEREKQEDNTEKFNKDNSSPLRFACWAGILSCYILYGAILFIFPLYARDRLGYSEANIGLMILVMMSFRVAGFQIISHLHFWHHKRLYVILTQALLVMFALMLGFFSHPVFYIAIFVLFGLVFSLQYSNSIFHGVYGSVKREGRMAVHESVIAVGIFIGSMGSGIVYDKFSMQTAFFACAVLLGILLIVQIMLVLKKSSITEKPA